MKKQTQKNLSSGILRSLFSSSQKREGSRALNIGKIIEHYAYAEAIVASIGYPLIILDSTLRIKSANNSFFKLLKLHKKETYGKYIFALAGKKWENPNLKQLLKDVLSKNIPLQELEVTPTFDNVGQKTLLLSARRITLDGYKTKLILLALEDISVRKIREAQKDDFIGFVTHELKTPLTSISIFSQILSDYHKKTQDKKSQFLLEKMRIQVERLSKLLDSFANVYKAQIGKLELHKERLDMNKLVSEIIETFQYIQTTHEIVRVGIVKQLIAVDKERINEVIVNLITNAIKYSPSSDKIIVKLIEDERNITFSVQDFGMGIPTDEKEKVFERFFRVKGKKEYDIQGLGLGLYLVSEIIKAHKGKLWIESIEGQGSTFFFSLPIKPKA